MIKLALFDLGETLISKGKPFPGAVAALEALGKLKTAAGQPLVLGLVSDYHPPAPPGGEAGIAAREEEYRAILETAGLERLFRPFAERVTLSTRAGASKPARKVFERAAERSGTGADLSECLFVTEEPAHLVKAKGHGLVAVRFGAGPGFEPAFAAWDDAPAVLGKLVAGG